MSVRRTAPSYADGTQVLAAYLASVDDSAWIAVTTDDPDATAASHAFTVVRIQRYLPNARLGSGPMTLDDAHSFARMQAESSRERASGRPGPVGE